MSGSMRVYIEMKNEETGEVQDFEIVQASVSISPRVDGEEIVIEGAIVKHSKTPVQPSVKYASGIGNERPIFKPGDRVKRVRGEYTWEGMYLGGIYVVNEIQEKGAGLMVEGLPRWYHQSHFEKVGD